MAGNQPPRWRANAKNGLLVGQSPAGPYLPTRNSGPLLQTEEQAQEPSIRQSVANTVAGTMGVAAGGAAGFAGSAYRLPSDALDVVHEVASFGRRLVRPSTPGGKAAWSAVEQAPGVALGALRYAITHPDDVAANAVGSLQNLGVRVFPDIRPDEPGRDQFHRNFNIGRAGGELQFQGALTAIPELRGLAVASAATRAELVAWLMSKGYNLRQANYLADAYPRKGHHVFARKRKLPEKVFGVPLPQQIAGKLLPKAASESPFNLLKPPGISRHGMYTLHSRVDKYFGGAGGLPDGGTWSAEELGIKPYDPVRRAWHGTPTATKKAVAAAAAAGAAAATLGYPERKTEGRR